MEGSHAAAPGPWAFRPLQGLRNSSLAEGMMAMATKRKKVKKVAAKPWSPRVAVRWAAKFQRSIESWDVTPATRTALEKIKALLTALEAVQK